MALYGRLPRRSTRTRPTLRCSPATRAPTAGSSSGVTSTGVYCRPICRVRTPRRENCRFYASAAQAEAAGFRPCLKCRPELAPDAPWRWSAMDASRTLARQAARARRCFPSVAGAAGNGGYEAGPLGPHADLARLAGRLGVSDRHLRRIFAAEHGVSPLQYVQTRRLLLAKRLLTDTALPVTEVALASGFASLRRFNAAFVQRYRMSPSRLRRTDAVQAVPQPPKRPPAAANLVESLS